MRAFQQVCRLSEQCVCEINAQQAEQEMQESTLRRKQTRFEDTSVNCPNSDELQNSNSALSVLAGSPLLQQKEEDYVRSKIVLHLAAYDCKNHWRVNYWPVRTSN